MVLPGVGAIVDEADGPEGLITMSARFDRIGIGAEDAHCDLFNAFALHSENIFFGDANRLPRSNDSTLEELPWRKCRLQMHV